MSAIPRASQILLVGQRIRQLRKSRHLTQADLASRIGITQSDLSRMESGEYKVGLDTLFRILQVFELSMSRFFEEPGEAEAAAEKAEKDDRALGEAEPGADRELLSDFAQLSDDSQREVREFIAFKKQQAAARRLKWPPDAAAESVDAANVPEPAGIARSPRRFTRHDVIASVPSVPSIVSDPPVSETLSGDPGPAPANEDEGGEGT